MRFRAVAVFLSIIIGSFVPSANFANAANPTPYKQWRHLMFEISLANFSIISTNQLLRPAGFDWTSDGCSAPIVGNSGLTFDFSDACRRHDFGYRNLKKMPGRWTTRARAEVDYRFKKDLRDSCVQRIIWMRPTCMAWSETFYRAVRTFAGP